MDTKFGNTSETEQMQDAVEEAYQSLDVDNMDKTGSVLYLLCGKDKNEQEFYAYMAIKPSLYREFMTKQAKGEIVVPTDYGVVLESGFGLLPSEDIQKDMQEKYGFNSDFEKIMQTQAEKLFNK